MHPPACAMTVHRRWDMQDQLSAVGSLQDSRTRIIAVGDPVEWQKTGRVLQRDDKILMVGFDDVTAELLAIHKPQLLVSPVLARRFDCIDLAMNLQALGYSGPYRAVAGEMPSPEMIEREIRQLCPSVDFQVVASL